jgi:hypothetical protein
MSLQIWAYRPDPRPELPWLEFELPVPPSVNRMMRRLGNRTPLVVSWFRQADMAFMASRTKQTLWRIGKFEAEFFFGRDRSDFHNREKCLFDWLQSRGFIENDKLCEWRGSGWSDDVPKGRVKVRLRPWMT